MKNFFHHSYIFLWLFSIVCLGSSMAIHDIDVTISGQDSLPIQSIQQMVRIDGSHARVIVDVVVEFLGNEWSSQAEGTFKIELPTGASPFLIGFGTEERNEEGRSSFLEYPNFTEWTSEEMASLRRTQGLSPNFKEARMAGRAVAAQSFNEIVNDVNVDPAILEGGAGSFSTRLFPFLQNDLHRITLGYDIPMEYMPDNSLRYDLPIPSAPKSNGSPEIRVEMITYEQPFFTNDAVDASIKESYPLQVEVFTTATTARSYSVEFKGAQNDLDSDISTVPDFPSPVLEAAPLVWGIVDGVHHFETQFRIPELTGDGGTDNSQITTETSQSHVVFAIETSFTTARNKESIDLYKQILTAVLENDSAIEYFNIMIFDVGVQWLSQPDEWLPNDGSARAKAVEFLDSILLEGATDLRLAIDEVIEQQQQQPQFDLFLLSSGVVSWGESDPNRIVALLSTSKDDDDSESLLLPRRVHTYHVGSSGGDPMLLRRLANARGGVFTSVDPGSPNAASSWATQHLLPRIALKSVTVEGALDLVVLGGRAGSSSDTPLLVVRPGQNVRVAWRAASSDTRTLQVELSGGLGTISTTMTLPGTPTNIGVRAYGILANTALEELLPLSEDMARSVALYYRVVGQTASLIMLESEQQYNDYNILESHPFSSVQNINPAQAIESISEEASRVARSAYQGLMDFLRKIQATGIQLSFPEDVSNLIFETELSDDSVDIASRTRKDTAFDRSLATIQSIELKEDFNQNGPEASYDSWTAESAIRLEGGSAFGALRALTSLLAQQPGDFVLRRDVALSSIEFGFPTGAFFAFEQVAETRPWEPMSYIQMAQTAQSAGLPSLAIVLFEVSMAGDWQERFAAFKEVSGMLYTRHLRQINDGTTVGEGNIKEFAAKREPEVRASFSAAKEAGLVVVTTWNQDRTDIDLHVTEPGGETCSFKNLETKSGGRLFGDVTDGYGPELYVQSNLNKRGKYKVEVNVFSGNQNRLSAPIKVLTEVFTNWGFSNEEYQAFTTVGREATAKMVHVTTVTLENPDSSSIKLPVGDLTIPTFPQVPSNSGPQFIGISGVDDSFAEAFDMRDDSDFMSSSSGSKPLGFDSVLFIVMVLSFMLTFALTFVE